MPDTKTSETVPCDGHHTRSPALPIPQLYREFVLDRDGGRCRLCPSNFPDIDDHPEVIHIFPRAVGGTNAISNFQIVCSSCLGLLITVVPWYGINITEFALICGLKEGTEPLVTTEQLDRYINGTINEFIINNTINKNDPPIINSIINNSINSDDPPPSDIITTIPSDTSSLGSLSSRDDNNISARDDTDIAHAGNADEDLLDIPGFLLRNPDGSFVDGK